MGECVNTTKLKADMIYICPVSLAFGLLMVSFFGVYNTPMIHVIDLFHVFETSVRILLSWKSFVVIGRMEFGFFVSLVI